MSSPISRNSNYNGSGSPVEVLKKNGVGKKRTTKRDENRNKNRDELHEKRALLMEGYKKVIRLFKVIERYYQTGEKRAFVVGAERQEKALTESKKAFRRLPNISNMNYSKIEKLIENQKQKVRDGVVIGSNKELKKMFNQIKNDIKTRKAESKDNAKEDLERKIKKNVQQLKILTKKAFEKYKNSQQMTNAEHAMKRYMSQIIDKLKTNLVKVETKIEQKRLASIKRKEAAEAAASARRRATEARRQQKQAELNVRKKERQQKREQQKQINSEKKAQMNAAKNNQRKQEIQKRQRAAQAEKESKEARAKKRIAAREEKEANAEAKKAVRNAKKALKEALNVAKQAEINAKKRLILTAPQKMTSKELRNLY